ncbi:MAG: PAS domain-containing protein, partial [Acidobacteria bacterium]|nr:PAS domain-containing protein [Acidobacteriota bacterium]
MEAGESRLEATGLEGPRRRADQLEPETPPLDGSALEVLLAHSPVPAWVHVDDRIVYVNAAAVRVLGAGGAGQIVGLSPANLLLNASDGHPGLAREQVIRRLDGSSFAAEVTAWPLAGAAASAIVVTFHDLSEGPRDLATAGDGSRLGESGLEGVAIHDGAALIDANGSLARMFSYELEDLIGRPLMDLVAPESQR